MLADAHRLSPILDFLLTKAGSYSGEGVNHEGEPFKAEFNLKMIAGGHGGQISFRARHGELTFHEERTWIAQDLLHETPALWTISTNTPGVLRLELRTDDCPAHNSEIERAMSFALGDPTRLETFREEIRLEFMRDGAIRYEYSWGVPGEIFGSRSRSKLHKLERPLPPSWL